MLDRVTLTGADDSVHPTDLFELSAQYPFVEWGILFSRSAQGRTRFPSDWWLDELGKNYRHDVKLSAHLCGKWVRDLLNGDPSWWDTYKSLNSLFDRVQVNTHAEPIGDAQIPTFCAQLYSLPWRTILQVDGVNDAVARMIVEGDLREGCVPLFDCSHGSGRLPTRWPEPWPMTYCGYAGGIGPDNVTQVIADIAASRADLRRANEQTFWIDMESNLFTGNRFSLAKCKRVLDACAPLVTTQAVVS